MTEAKWLAATDPRPMLEFLRSKTSGRKLRLFAAAACRLSVQLNLWPDGERALDVAERFADGAANGHELAVAQTRVWLDTSHFGSSALAQATYYDPEGAALSAALVLADDAGRRAVADALAAAPNCDPDVRVPDAAQAAAFAMLAELLREVIGNPFAALLIAPAWLAWQGGALRKLAQAVYNQRRLPSGELDLFRLRVLADALEDAGCADAELLGHLRGPGPHVRGCWAVDLVLGKG